MLTAILNRGQMVISMIKNKNLPIYIMGIDIGTTNVKAGLFDLENLELKEIIINSYNIELKQNCIEIWDKTKESIIRLLKKIDNNSIKAIGLSGQMHGSVFYDKDKRVFKDFMSWQDRSGDYPLNRYGGRSTVDIINELVSSTEKDELGIDRIPTGYMISTLYYLKENDKSFYKKIKYVTLPVDYIRGKLLGKFDFKTDKTNAGSTGMFNIRKYKWHEGLLKKLKVSKKLLPKFYNSYDIAGYISKENNNLFGFTEKVPIIFGGGDNQISLFGSGLDFLDTKILLNIGTGSQISKVIKDYKKIKGIETRCYIDGKYMLVGASLAGGNIYNKLKDKYRLSYKDIDDLAAKTPVGSNGLIFSTGPTRIDPNKKRGFIGKIIGENQIGVKARATIEGILYDLLSFYEKFADDNEKYIIGTGGSLINSKIWGQIASDMLGKKLKITKFDSTILGSSLLAARAIGLNIDYDSLFNRRIIYKEYKPDLKNTEIYKKIRYKILGT